MDKRIDDKVDSKLGPVMDKLSAFDTKLGPVIDRLWALEDKYKQHKEWTLFII